VLAASKPGILIIHFYVAHPLGISGWGWALSRRKGCDTASTALGRSSSKVSTSVKMA
jgi:hypothetical protein